MKFFAIKPATCVIETIEASDPHQAQKMIGLDRVDHGVIALFTDGGGASIIVDEFSLYVPVDEQRWFSIFHQLFGGNALLYGFDAAGETCEFDLPPPIVFYPNAHEVEAAIRRGQIDRPKVAFNDNVVLQWPERRPPETEIMIAIDAMEKR